MSAPDWRYIFYYLLSSPLIYQIEVLSNEIFYETNFTDCFLLFIANMLSVLGKSISKCCSLGENAITSYWSMKLIYTSRLHFLETCLYLH